MSDRSSPTPRGTTTFFSAGELGGGAEGGGEDDLPRPADFAAEGFAVVAVDGSVVIRADSPRKKLNQIIAIFAKFRSIITLYDKK